MNTKKFLVALIGGVSLLGAASVNAQPTSEHEVIVKQSAETIEYNYGDDTIVALVKATYPELENKNLVVSSIISQGPITQVELLAVTGDELFDIEIDTVTVRFIHIHDDHWEFEIIKFNNEDVVLDFDLSNEDVIKAVKEAYPSMAQSDLLVTNVNHTRSTAEVELVNNESLEPLNVVFIHNKQDWICLGKKSVLGDTIEFDLSDEDIVATIKRAYPEYSELDICFSSVITEGTLTEIEFLVFPNEDNLDAPIGTMTIVFIYDNDIWLFLGEKPTVQNTIPFDLADEEIIRLVSKAYPGFAGLNLFVSSISNQGHMAWIDFVVVSDNETEIISILFAYENDEWIVLD